MEKKCERAICLAARTARSALQTKCPVHLRMQKDGFVKITELKFGGRTGVEADCCDGCRMVIFSY